MGFIIGPVIRRAGRHAWAARAFIAAAVLALLNTGFGLIALPESLPPESRRPFQWSRANPLGTLLQIRHYPSVA